MKDPKITVIETYPKAYCYFKENLDCHAIFTGEEPDKCISSSHQGEHLAWHRAAESIEQQKPAPDGQ